MIKRTGSASHKKPQLDYYLLSAVLLLAIIGLIMMFSASSPIAIQRYADKWYFLRKQSIFFLIGIASMFACFFIPRSFFYKHIYLWMSSALLLLVLTSFSPLGLTAGGATRWLDLKIITIQPLEFAKLALVFYLSYFFAKKQKHIKIFAIGFIPPLLASGSLAALLIIQPDFGGAAFIMGILFFMCLVGGTRLRYLFPVFAIAGMAAWMLIAQSPYRLKRWTAFLDPFKAAHDAGYQTVQSYYALGSGKLMGVGLGDGTQKLFYLPEAHNDFIMAVIGEETGFIGMTVVFLLVGLILFRSLQIAYRQNDLQDRFMAFGLTLILALGFFLNLGVVLGLIPPKGVPMPFISYGGSHLLVTFLAIGWLLNISGRKK